MFGGIEVGGLGLGFGRRLGIGVLEEPSRCVCMSLEGLAFGCFGVEIMMV